jgi:non-ribosomal peptide synthetase component F
MASSCGATLFMALMATWQLLLARYSRMEDVITLTTVANNLKRPDLAEVLGPFSNLVALRTDFSGEKPPSPCCVQAASSHPGMKCRSEVALRQSPMCWVLLHAGAPTVRQLLGRVKAGVLSALVHSELPFKEVLAALSQSADDVDDMPRFQSALNLEDNKSQGSLRGFTEAGLDVARLQVKWHCPTA